MNLLIILLLICFISSILCDCSDYTTCLTCAEDLKCSWCEISFTNEIKDKSIGKSSYCYDLTSITTNQLCNSIGTSKSYRYEDTCPFESSNDLFLSNWFGKTINLIGDLTILDISLPGTHDTLTSDLSLTVSDGGADDMIVLAELLHNYTKIIPNGIEDYIRQQSQTQELNIVEQLNNGIRFLDIRMMFQYTDYDSSATDTNELWYSLHFMESSNTMIKYFNDIRSWLDDHPSEMIVMWLSKHGSECATGDEQYPNTSIEIKQSFWYKILDIFDGLVTDFTVSNINSTTINTMISRNHRVIFYTSDYIEFTDSSNYALDSCLIVNELGPSVTNEPNAYSFERNIFSNSKNLKLENLNSSKFLLLSLSTGVPSQQMISSFDLRFFPNNPLNDNITTLCSNSFNIPDMAYCPLTLLDIANLENYYKQITLEETINSIVNAVSNNDYSTTWGFPNAIYINGVDNYGTIRTGTQVLWGKERESTSSIYSTMKYSYVDTLLLYNLYVGCYTYLRVSNSNDKLLNNKLECNEMISYVNERRLKYPITLWNNPEFGRLEDWP